MAQNHTLTDASKSQDAKELHGSVKVLSRHVLRPYFKQRHPLNLGGKIECQRL